MIKLENQHDEYERKVLTFLEVTGTLGGIYELIIIAAGLMVGVYSKSIFEHQVSNDLNIKIHTLQVEKEKMIQEAQKSRNQIPKKPPSPKPGPNRPSCISSDIKIPSTHLNNSLNSANEESKLQTKPTIPRPSTLRQMTNQLRMQYYSNS